MENVMVEKRKAQKITQIYRNITQCNVY